jgi:hypothetical protein
MWKTAGPVAGIMDQWIAVSSGAGFKPAFRDMFENKAWRVHIT